MAGEFIKGYCQLSAQCFLSLLDGPGQQFSNNVTLLQLKKKYLFEKKTILAT